MRSSGLVTVLTSLMTIGCSKSDNDAPNTASFAGLSEDTALSCLYKKTSAIENGSSSSDWHFVREKNRTESRDSASQQGEIWERDSQGRLFLTHVFFAEQAALDYSPGDLNASGRLPAWEAAWSIIDPTLLGKELKLIKKTTDGNGIAEEIYQGKWAGNETEIHWLPGLRLPTYVKKQAADGQQTLTIMNCWPIDKAAIQPTNESTLSAYRHIDYSDLGDMETDPLVQKIVALSGGHSHGGSQQEEHHETH
jgi:hypothetical protein